MDGDQARVDTGLYMYNFVLLERAGDGTYGSYYFTYRFTFG